MSNTITFTDDKHYEDNTIIPVEAIYHHPLLKYDENNRLICALPPKMTPDEVKKFCYTQLPIEPSIDADVFTQEAEVELLGMLCLPLEPVIELSDRITTILTNSYRKRTNDLIIPNRQIFVAC